MSRIGRRPISVPNGVDFKLGDDNFVTVKGPKGTLRSQLQPGSDDHQRRRHYHDRAAERSIALHRSMHGLSRTLLNNMVYGVTAGLHQEPRYHRRRLSRGNGRQDAGAQRRLLPPGADHPADGVAFAVEGNTKVSVSGYDKQVVGEEAARIRRVRPPEPYKGKGIRYEGEGSVARRARPVRPSSASRVQRRPARESKDMRLKYRKALSPRKRRHVRVRAKVCGHAGRPRLNVFRSSAHMYCQVIDDIAGHTIVAASDLDEDVEERDWRASHEVGSAPRLSAR